MGWRDLIEDAGQTIVVPWTGGRSLHSCDFVSQIEGPLPREHGWYEFSLAGRKATLVGIAEADPEQFSTLQLGFLVGNRFVPDDASPDALGENWLSRFHPVFLVEEGLDRFSRVEVGVVGNSDRLIFSSQAFPLGPEDEVLRSFLDKQENIEHVKDVIPGLQAAFELETSERNRAEERRRAAVQRRLEEQALREREERRRQLTETLGTGAGRREMAAIDFHSAAEAALAVGGAELLDVRNGRGSERVVRYRLAGRRFECVCDLQMRIIDAGVCLTDEQTGEKGDTFFTLESLPGVIQQAEREGVLVIFRHA